MRRAEQLARQLRELEERQAASDLDQAGTTARQQLLSDTVAAGACSTLQDDRRRLVRLPVRLDVRFRAGDASVSARIAELSLGGMTLASYLWLRDEQKLLADAMIVDGREFCVGAPCRVAWRRATDQAGGHRAGLQFLPLNERARHSVADVFEAVLAKHLADAN
ncbi:MAG: PilZ domain-containing protein [Deltaproteobacteria bacterium]|nr:PilZ domain-containing protein [Deltaproteobacteria bacterium]